MFHRGKREKTRVFLVGGRGGKLRGGEGKKIKGVGHLGGGFLDRHEQKNYFFLGIQGETREPPDPLQEGDPGPKALFNLGWIQAAKCWGNEKGGVVEKIAKSGGTFKKKKTRWVKQQGEGGFVGEKKSEAKPPGPDTARRGCEMTFFCISIRKDQSRETKGGENLIKTSRGGLPSGVRLGCAG